MIVLGLTGSIATGKSTVAGMFAEAGIPVYDADKAVHELYAGEAVDAVEAAFPGTTRDGQVDRTALSQQVLGDPEALKRLEALIHPLVREKMLGFIETRRTAGAGLVILEIPLLFETGQAYPVDAIAVTWCEPAIQRERALARDGMSEDKLAAILARQMPQDEKRDRADFEIDTSGDFASVRNQVAKVIEACRDGLKR
ncbi:dephospho-CoA kinase [Cucumibacter marinus]|uniref:dephospho-CoA kinase n=1 Tax=Cucumibacter marinus TaxID=1121252 RepID=UPI000403D212|nr:dephospho-CoA kinase [Cucumibacter marinus]